MDKKDIYEHLANIYLDASLKRKKKTPAFQAPRILFVISVLILAAAIFLFTQIKTKQSVNSELALIIQPEAVKVNFHFDPAKKETYSVNLNKLNLTRFKVLGFSAKKANYQDKINLRVEFRNVFREQSEVYLRDIPHRWQEYRIKLADFKTIHDWSEMENLSFIAEEWNIKEKQGVVYLDNIRLLR